MVTETFDWDEEEVSDDEEMTQVKVLMDLVDDELSVGNNHARNGEWINITMKDEKVNSFQKIQESKHVTSQSESSNSLNSSKMSQESKQNVKNTDSSKSVRPKPL
ncbi:hypothetical protein Tco_1208273 [Tanacetum coccineum]